MFAHRRLASACLLTLNSAFFLFADFSPTARPLTGTGD